MKRQKPIKPVSTKRAAQLRLYAKLRKDFLEKNCVCMVDFKERVCAMDPSYEEACAMTPGLFRSATQVHHRGKRRGEALNDTTKWLAVSSHWHVYLEEHKNWARQRGYLDNF